MPTTDDITTVRLTGRRGLLAAVPAMLGFHPQESLVMVCFAGPRRRVGPVVRVDLLDPAGPPGSPTSIAPLHLYAQKYADEVALMCYTESARTPPEFEEVLAAVEAAGIIVLDAVVVRGGTAHPCPMFTGGTEFDDDDDPDCELPDDDDPQVRAMAAAYALNGRGMLADRQALRDSIAGPTGAGAIKATASLHAAADGLLGDARSSGPLERDVLRRMATVTVDRALTQAAGRGEVAPATAALLALLLCDNEIRDEMIARAVNDLASEWVPMLIGVARVTPDELAAQVCCVLSLAAYRRGDGALAQVAVDRCLDADPNHRLAHLMLGVMAAGLPPAELVHLAGGDRAISPGSVE